LASLLTEPASAHLDVRPRIVEAGAAVDLLVELPRLRPGPRPVALELEADGLDVMSTRLIDTVGGDTLWTARIRVRADAGTLPIVLRAVYADGRSVEADESLVVLGAEESSFAWGIVALAVTGAVGLAGAALLLVRRRA
jgi:hypothetical protein